MISFTNETEAAGQHRRFIKLSGAGNDFIFVDARQGGFGVVERRELARRLCDRRFGVGADGAVFVETCVKGTAEYRWDFYNSDGSTAEMCGNAARCMARWAQHAEGVAPLERTTFETAAGRASCAMHGEVAEADLPFVGRSSRVIDGGWLYDIGVPHAVVEVQELDRAQSADGARLIERLRWLPEAGARGANVTFFARSPQPGRISSTTFERGVEGFTMACGTGVIAAALASLGEGFDDGKEVAVTVVSPGGVMEVSFEASRPGVRLRGPASFVCEGEFAEEFLR